MTPDEIDALPPERLLEEVARLDGWDNISSGPLGFLCGDNSGAQFGVIKPLPPYTTSLARAVELLMRLFDRERYCIQVFAGYRESGLVSPTTRSYKCRIQCPGWSFNATTECDTASALPAAICRTILKAANKKEKPND